MWNKYVGRKQVTMSKGQNQKERTKLFLSENKLKLRLIASFKPPLSEKREINIDHFLAKKQKERKIGKGREENRGQSVKSNLIT